MCVGRFQEMVLQMPSAGGGALQVWCLNRSHSKFMSQARFLPCRAHSNFLIQFSPFMGQFPLVLSCDQLWVFRVSSEDKFLCFQIYLIADSTRGDILKVKKWLSTSVVECWGSFPSILISSAKPLEVFGSPLSPPLFPSSLNYLSLRIQGRFSEAPTFSQIAVLFFCTCYFPLSWEENTFELFQEPHKTFSIFHED